MRMRQSQTADEHVKPFLKWAGGKRRLLPDILKLIPEEYNNYYEPFLGGGSLFFELRPQKAYLSDINEELMSTYVQVRDSVDDVIGYLKKMKYNKSSYYRIRSMQVKNGARRAARFIYLNRTCWNGLYRENANGEFNVPIGRYTNPLICNETRLKAASKQLKNTFITCCDFAAALQDVKEKDLIYLDPPYVTSHSNNAFIKYNSRIFSMYDQSRLRDIVDTLDKLGCFIVVSNANTAHIRRMYKGFNITVAERKSTIAGSKMHRDLVTELLITNHKINEKSRPQRR